MNLGRRSKSWPMQSSHSALKPGGQVSGSSSRFWWMVTWKMTCSDVGLHQGWLWQLDRSCCIWPLHAREAPLQAKSMCRWLSLHCLQWLHAQQLTCIWRRPAQGRCPVSISHKMTPKAYTSAALLSLPAHATHNLLGSSAAQHQACDGSWGCAEEQRAPPVTSQGTAILVPCVVRCLPGAIAQHPHSMHGRTATIN